MSRPLEGRSAIVTGAGTGIGKATALEFARRGARLTLSGRKAEPLQATLQEVQGLGGEGQVVPTDIRVPEQAERMVQAAVERFGRVDILFNNAGANFACPALQLSENAWNAVMGINLHGTFYCSQAAARRMLKQKSGSIVNNVTPLAWTGAPGMCHTVTSKAAAIALTKSLAVEWARFKVRVNAVAPGAIITEGSKERFFSIPGAYERIRDRVPLQRWGTPEDIALAVAFLVSDEADYITGEVLTVDGGDWLMKYQL
ncbi:MAG: SDR family oxidoreductase [Euryarchaeota archaeon]|nr:SDR family oxidoreductase [Euryarchaeota archaeon]